MSTDNSHKSDALRAAVKPEATAESSNLVQFKAQLADMSYDDQVRAVQPSLPVQLHPTGSSPVQMASDPATADSGSAGDLQPVKAPPVNEEFVAQAIAIHGELDGMPLFEFIKSMLGGTTEAAPAAEAHSAAPEPTGIAATLAVGRFTSIAAEVAETWSEVTWQERGNKLANAYRDELAAIGVADVKVQPIMGLPQAGVFTPSDWLIRIQGETVTNDAATKDQIVDFSATIYHEARHAEQTFRVAQMLAAKPEFSPGGSPSADLIAAHLHIPADVAAAAAATPMSSGGAQEMAEAAAWYESVWGGGKANHKAVCDNVMAALTASGQADAYAAQLAADPAASDEQKAQAADIAAQWDAEFQRCYEAYRALVEEHDAHLVGDLVSNALNARFAP